MGCEVRKRELVDRLTSVRERTLWLLEQVPDEFLRRRVHDFYSPVGWHFGHVGRTEEYWVIGEALGRPLLNDRLSFIFADLPENPKDNRVHIPDRNEIVEYLRATRQRVLDALTEVDISQANAFLADGYAWEFAIQHECQHQETIAELLQLIQKQLPQQCFEPLPWTEKSEIDWVQVPAGSYRMGSSDPRGYDNEKEPHDVQVQSFLIAKYPVTAFQWSKFIEAEGYKNPEHWSEEGWDWCKSESASAPEYWVPTDNGWGYLGPWGMRALHPEEPASSLSWYESEAYARWKGLRLPTEQEWEWLAKNGSSGDSNYWWGNECITDELACHGLTTWGATPVGSRRATPLGVHDLAGNVWEWTSSSFLPYPGFRAFPYDGYSKDHMQGRHRVCRGGSWATSAGILRSSFRNWYVPGYRQGFLGVRLAK